MLNSTSSQFEVMHTASLNRHQQISLKCLDAGKMLSYRNRDLCLRAAYEVNSNHVSNYLWTLIPVPDNPDNYRVRNGFKSRHENMWLSRNGEYVYLGARFSEASIFTIRSPTY